MWAYFEAFGRIIFYLLKLGGQKVDAATQPARKMARQMILVLKVLGVIFTAVPVVLMVLGLVLRHKELLAIAACLSSFGAFLLLAGSNQFGALFKAIDLPLGPMKHRVEEVGLFWVGMLQSLLLTISGTALFTLLLPVFDHPFVVAVMFIAMMGLVVIGQKVPAISTAFRFVVYTFVTLTFLGCGAYLVFEGVKQAAIKPGNPINEAIEYKNKVELEQARRDSIDAYHAAQRAKEERAAAERARAETAAERLRLAEIEARRPNGQPVRTIVERVPVYVSPPVSSNPPTTYEPPVSPPSNPPPPSYNRIDPENRPRLAQMDEQGLWFDIERVAIIPSTHEGSRFRLTSDCAINWESSYIIYNNTRRSIHRGEFELPNLRDGHEHELVFHLVCRDASGDQVGNFTYRIKNNKLSG